MKLKFELINGYGVLVDEKTEIKKGDYVTYQHDGLCITKIINTFESHRTDCNKIIFAEKELGLKIPVFEWRDFEVEKLANEKFDFSLNKVTFIQGYKSNPARFTEEDLRKAIELALIDAEKSVLWSVNYHIHLSNKIIESLQKYPQYVVMENNTVKELIW